VQAGYVNDEIRRLRAKYPDIPLHAVVQDLCASGGYYIAVAADKIYVDKASLVGSIGVIMGGFGFVGSIDKLGVERRAYASGDNKDFLDPFLPENPQHRAHAQKMIGEIHQQFVKVVREGRGKRLKETPETFSGLVWTGKRASSWGSPMRSAAPNTWRARCSTPSGWSISPSRRTTSRHFPSGSAPASARRSRARPRKPRHAPRSRSASA
jgi:hypothetical protein